MENEVGTKSTATPESVAGGVKCEPLDPMQKAGILQAVSQLEMLSQIFPNAPKRVVEAHKEFTAALKEWASE